MAIPAPIPAAAIEEIRRLAGGRIRRGVLRGPGPGGLLLHGRGQILINEINTIPGLSPASYFQKMWEATGLPFPELIDRLLQTALRKGTGLR